VSNQEAILRIRKLRIATVFFVTLFLLAAYGLALLRTYTFQPSVPPDNKPGVNSLLNGATFPTKGIYSVNGHWVGPDLFNVVRS
jgi:hypothetical protein